MRVPYEFIVVVVAAAAAVVGTAAVVVVFIAASRRRRSISSVLKYHLRNIERCLSVCARHSISLNSIFSHVFYPHRTHYSRLANF